MSAMLLSIATLQKKVYDILTLAKMSDQELSRVPGVGTVAKKWLRENYGLEAAVSRLQAIIAMERESALHGDMEPTSEMIRAWVQELSGLLF